MKNKYKFFKVSMTEFDDEGNVLFSSLVSEEDLGGVIRDYKKYIEKCQYRPTRKSEIDQSKPSISLTVTGYKPHREIGKYTEERKLYARYYQ